MAGPNRRERPAPTTKEKAPARTGAIKRRGRVMSTTESVTLFDDLPQIVMEGDTARARESDPLTSHAAADSSNRADSQQAVLTALAVHKHLAGFELEALLPEWSGSRVRTAVKELVEQGRVRKSDREPRLTRFGRAATVWELA